MVGAMAGLQSPPTYNEVATALAGELPPVLAQQHIIQPSQPQKLTLSNESCSSIGLMVHRVLPFCCVCFASSS